MSPTPSPPPEGITVEAQAVLFGFPPTQVQASIRPRPVSWRATRAAQMLGISLVVSPFAAIVPPHAPWAIGALATGVILARRRWIERYTLESAEGKCPKCGEALVVKSARLKDPHPVTCEACHHQSTLRIAAELLEAPVPRAG